MAQPSFTRVERDSAYQLSYRWGALGDRWAVDLAVPTARYASAARAGRSIPRCYDQALANPIVARLAADLARTLDAAGVDAPLARLRVVTDLVRSFEYVTDAAATGNPEYPKYVAQTLVDAAGDCEDLATLLAGVLAAPHFEHRTALVFFSGHVGVGVDPDPFGDAVGSLLTVGGREYLYVDASTHVPIGTIPAEYVDPGVVAVYDGEWSALDLAALSDHAVSTVDDGDPFDPWNYV